MARHSKEAERRRQVLAEWRGYREPRQFVERVLAESDQGRILAHGYHEGRPLMERVQGVGVLINKAMLALGLGERVREAEVLQAWKETVGDFIAAHSAPHRLKDGVLYVRVLQPSVHYEMERMRGSITAKLKERFGVRTVREVRFRVG